ncbi:MAG: RNA polymerase sigma factor [Planctomycetota bacterium]|nr:MAG: RNA polymerase sigma factor [Planctomycetota bacterium]
MESNNHADRSPGACKNEKPVVDGKNGVVSGEQAIGEIFENLRPRLVRLAYRFLWNTHDAEEIVQDALVLAWQRIRLSSPHQRNAWLYRTTINLSLNRLRKKRSGMATADDFPTAKSVDPAGPLQTNELMERVRYVIAQLPDRQQGALILRDIEQLSYHQIATIFKIRPGAARLLVHRAREKVRRMLLQKWPDCFGPEQ